MDKFRDLGGDTGVMRAERMRTPSSLGYRPHMSSSAFIGETLGSLYPVGHDVPTEFEAAIRDLDKCRTARR